MISFILKHTVSLIPREKKFEKPQSRVRTIRKLPTTLFYAANIFFDK